MNFAIIIGSDTFIGTSGLLSYETEAGVKDFFRIREIDRSRSDGSHLVVDCDIKDADGEREVKLFKSRPVAESEEVIVNHESGHIEVLRNNGSMVVRVEEVHADDPSLPTGPAAEYLQNVDAILRITGNFLAGPHRVIADTTKTQIGSIQLSGNVSVGTGGIRLGPNGFAM